MNTILILFNRRRNISTPTIRTKIITLLKEIPKSVFGRIGCTPRIIIRFVKPSCFIHSLQPPCRLQITSCLFIIECFYRALTYHDGRCSQATFSVFAELSIAQYMHFSIRLIYKLFPKICPLFRFSISGQVSILVALPIMPVSRITWIIEFINIHCINSLPIRIIYTILSYFFISSMQLF